MADKEVSNSTSSSESLQAKSSSCQTMPSCTSCLDKELFKWSDIGRSGAVCTSLVIASLTIFNMPIFQALMTWTLAMLVVSFLVKLASMKFEKAQTYLDVFMIKQKTKEKVKEKFGCIGSGYLLNSLQLFSLEPIGKSVIAAAVLYVLPKILTEPMLSTVGILALLFAFVVYPLALRYELPVDNALQAMSGMVNSVCQVVKANDPIKSNA